LEADLAPATVPHPNETGTTVPIDNVSHDRKAQSRTGLRSGFGAAEESLEYVWLVSTRDAGPTVEDGNRVRLDIDLDGSA
jgi:hypothetical protein